jgi:hypothetical protein
MKPKFLTQLFLFVFVSLSLYSCTADPVDDTKSKATGVTPTKPKTPTDVTAEYIIYKPR